MAEKLSKWLIGVMGGISSLTLGKELIIFIISMLPILELRGGLIAASLMNMNPISSFIICVIGNIIPIPLILWFIVPVLNKLKSFKRLTKWIDKLESKVLKKQSKIEKYEFWGLVLFIGVPLPGTGVWTGCLIAALIGMDKKSSTLAALLGVLIASVIMMFVSFGILGRIW